MTDLDDLATLYDLRAALRRQFWTIAWSVTCIALAGIAILIALVGFCAR